MEFNALGPVVQGLVGCRPTLDPEAGPLNPDNLKYGDMIFYSGNRLTLRFFVLTIRASLLKSKMMNDVASPSSRGLGHRPFTAVTGVRVP